MSTELNVLSNPVKILNRIKYTALNLVSIFIMREHESDYNELLLLQSCNHY